ncbi:MAG TPA: protein-L-isoaspartate(D-aspartate) O-methyltransferase [Xanthomonadales bacterium]|nr:protein-L-isoaspartate(D-aspartate) O-methyltransferase [Xanthomonadales bacterium]
MRTLALAALLVVACKSSSEPPPKKQPVAKPEPEQYDPFREARQRMVDRTIAARGVDDVRVIEAMRHVPRHELVPEDVRENAYDDRPLPIGFDKTISQPYIVAAMTAAAKLRPGDKVLEVGTGSGYQAAVLAELGNEVYTIEIIPELAERARLDLVRIGYPDVKVRAGDGYAGWRDAAPFDAILVTAAAPTLPRTLYDQLVEGGRMVIPLGVDDQVLQVITRTPDGPVVENLLDVRFGPMLGDPQ